MKKCILSWVYTFSFLVSAGSLLADAVETSVVSIKGSVEQAVPGSSTFEKLNKGDRLKVGSKIRTGADGAVFISPFPGAAAQIGANSVVTIAEVDVAKKGDKVVKRKALLDVTQGSVITSIDKRSRGIDFRVRSPKSVASAKGTVFSVSQGAGGSWTLVVAEGTVEITLPGGEKRSVKAGEKVVIFANGSLSQNETLPKDSPELAAARASQQVAVALSLLDGSITEGDADSFTAGAVSDGNLILVNPANVSGEVSPQ